MDLKTQGMPRLNSETYRVREIELSCNLDDMVFVFGGRYGFEDTGYTAAEFRDMLEDCVVAVFVSKSESQVCTAYSLQHTATHCNTLQHTATHCNAITLIPRHSHTATNCIIL